MYPSDPIGPPLLQSVNTSDFGAEWDWQRCHSPYYKSMYHQNGISKIFEVVILSQLDGGNLLTILMVD